MMVEMRLALALVASAAAIAVAIYMFRSPNHPDNKDEKSNRPKKRKKTLAKTNTQPAAETIVADLALAKPAKPAEPAEPEGPGASFEQVPVQKRPPRSSHGRKSAAVVVVATEESKSQSRKPPPEPARVAPVTAAVTTAAAKGTQKSGQRTFRCFSMGQPFASLLVGGVKTLETRRSPFLADAPPSEWLALHVGSKTITVGASPSDVLETLEPNSARRAKLTDEAASPRGYVVALVRLGNHRRLSAAEQRSAAGLQRRACVTALPNFVSDVLEVASLKPTHFLKVPFTQCRGGSGTTGDELRLVDLPLKTLPKAVALSNSNAGANVSDSVSVSASGSSSAKKPDAAWKQEAKKAALEKVEALARSLEADEAFARSLVAEEEANDGAIAAAGEAETLKTGNAAAKELQRSGEPPETKRSEKEEGSSEGFTVVGKGANRKEKKKTDRSGQGGVKKFVLLENGVNLLEGCSLHYDVFDAALEARLVSQVDAYASVADHSGRPVDRRPGYARRDFQAGPRFDDYQSQRIVTQGEAFEGRPFSPNPMPAVAFELGEALAARRVGPPGKQAYDIFLANNYEPGQYTANHTDSRLIQRPLIVSSLLAEGEIVFGRRLVAEVDGRGNRVYGGKGCPSVTIKMPPRSTMVLTGAAADEVQHAVNTVSERRISILLRKTHLQKGAGVLAHPDPR